MKRIYFLLFALIFLLAACAPAPAPLPQETPSPEPITLPTETAQPQPEQGGGGNNGPLQGEQFEQHLAQVLENRDFSALEMLVGEQFAVATWNSALNVYPSAEGLRMLAEGPLGPGAQPAVVFGTDVQALLSGTDPLDLWGPVADPVRAVHITGLGPLGLDEGVLVIARGADGFPYFHGILLPPDGYFHGDGISGDAGAVVNTDVRFVQALRDLNMRAGPGTVYPVVGPFFAGQTAAVNAQSADGGWWRVPCPEDENTHCWLSADPALTQPTER